MVPLALGNSWSYSEVPAPGFTGDTTNYSLTVIKDTIMSLTIQGATDIGHWFRVSGQAGLVPTYYANRSSGHWVTFRYDDGQFNILITTLTAKYPAVTGDIFSRPFPAPIQSTSQNVE
ncbi:MAG: hypothetical protein ACREBV_07920, partial [Candidatus Zixiibacteriota bacterium]